MADRDKMGRPKTEKRDEVIKMFGQAIADLTWFGLELFLLLVTYKSNHTNKSQLSLHEYIIHNMSKLRITIIT